MHGKLAIGKICVDFGLTVGGMLGKAWHVPCTPMRSTRDILAIAAETLGVTLRISAMPAWMLGASAKFSPFRHELVEMRFRWDRPHRVDAGRFASAFWANATPFETGVSETAHSFRSAMEAEALKLQQVRSGRRLANLAQDWG